MIFSCVLEKDEYKCHSCSMHPISFLYLRSIRLRYFQKRKRTKTTIFYFDLVEKWWDKDLFNNKQKNYCSTVYRSFWLSKTCLVRLVNVFESCSNVLLNDCWLTKDKFIFFNISFRIIFIRFTRGTNRQRSL